MSDDAVVGLTMLVFRPCAQERCSFNIGGVGCRECVVCRASPYVIRRGCDRCFACENVPGALRWGRSVGKDVLLTAQLLRESQERGVVLKEGEREREKVLVEVVRGK